jgi:predicted outer membrane lipoprotein
MTRKNMALVVAAQNVCETYNRLSIPVEELTATTRFGLLLATAISVGDLRGTGNVSTLEVLNAAYADLTIMWWEHEEEKRRAQEALARVKADAAAGALLDEVLGDAKPQSLDEVLADTPPLYRVGNELTVRFERWAVPRAATVTRARWRGADSTLPAAWLYDLKTDDGTYMYAETDTDWDVDFAG